MTREEAIRELREDKALYETDNCHAGDGSPDGDLLEALDMAIEALKERPTGKWVGGQEYCKHLEEKTGERYAPTGLGKLIYCNQCWQASNSHSAYCPNCGADMRGEVE